MRILTKVALAALCSTAMATPAFAQGQDVQDEGADDDVIIVTAQRRAQDVQDIPLAVTAISPVQLERQGVVNVQNIGSISPSFSTSNAQNAAGTVVLRIRGVGTTSNNIGFESAVGIFIDGAYQSRPGVALSEFVDVERVEVLRGPQGTLFGRNTSAGALNITNKRPDLNEFGGFVNATYGNYDHISIQGAVNVPIIQDTLAARFSGAYRKRDGFVRVIDGTGEIGRSNETDQYIVRGQLGYESDGGVKARLILDYSELNGNCCNAPELLKSPLETAGVFALAGLGTGGNFVPAGNGATSITDLAGGQRALDGLTASESFPATNALDQWGVVGEIEVPVGDNANIIYIGSYREFNSSARTDSDFTSLDLFNAGGSDGTIPTGLNIDTMTHELRVQGEAFDGALDWLVGAYYSDEKINSVAFASIGQDWDRFIGALLLPSTRGAFGATPLATFSGGQNANAASATSQFIQKSESFSFFTHNTLEVVDGLKFTVGLRYSDESKDGSFQQLAVNPGACNGIVNNILGGPLAAGQPRIPGGLVPTILVTGCFPFVAPVDLPGSAALPLPRSFSGTTFKDKELIYTGKVSYEFADPVTIYGSFTHGFKSGGFNLDASAAIGGADPRFASEEVDAYEFGLKAKFIDNAVTFNLAMFLEEFTNFQVLEFTGAQFQTFNVPKARSKGFEIESTIRPDDHLTFNMALTYTDAEYPGDCAATTDALRVQNLCGNPLTNAPQYVGIAGATYRNTIGDSLSYFLNAQVRAESDRRTSTQARDVPTTQAALGTTPLLPFDIQDGNIKINMRAGIGDIDEAWGLEFWVTNLTNEITRGVTFSTTLRSGSRSTFPQEPRMFGVTARGKF